MKKSKQLGSSIYLFLFIAIGIMAIVYPISIIYNDVIYFNRPYLTGKVKDIQIEESNSPESAGYYIYKYVISTNDTTYCALTDKKFVLAIDDKVKCFQTGAKTVKIICVNGKKIQNKYGTEDCVSLIILISLFVVITGIIINKK